MSNDTTTATSQPPPVSKPYDHSGTDLKSVLLNISSIVFFLIPFFLYYVNKSNTIAVSTEEKQQYYIGTFGVTLCIYLLAYIAPPRGWRRPHPYSDDPTNVPYTFTKRD